jgi:type I restriction enzyme S subunit
MSDWFDGQLSDAIASLDAGVSVNAEDRPHGAGEIGVLKTSAVSGGAFHPKQNKTVVERERRLASESVNGDSILVSRMNTPALVGESCYVAEPHPSLFLPDRLWQLKPKHRSSVNVRWLSFVLQTSAYRSYVDVHATGTSGSMRNLPKSRLLAFPVRYPSLTEQAKIAEILDTCDAAVQKTEALIDNLKAIKRGLLHDLLTRGIDASGRLRPQQSEAPHLYKASPLGWIPTEWDAVRLDGVLAPVDPAMRSGPFGSALLKHELVAVGHPLLGIDNVYAERFVSDYTRFVSPQKFAQLARYAVRPADLMITIMGTVGRCCLVPDDIEQALSSKHTWTITLDSEKYSPYLAMLQINYSPWVLRHFAKDQQGGTMAAIRSETLRSTLLPSPPRDEQRLIEERLREISKRIDLEEDAVEKMRLNKSALMDDLLTGRVRVTPLPESAPA